MILIRPTGDTTPQELPPVHPMCKVFLAPQLEARAKALRKKGEVLLANELLDAVRAAVLGTLHQP